MKVLILLFSVFLLMSCNQTTTNENQTTIQNVVSVNDSIVEFENKNEVKFTVDSVKIADTLLQTYPAKKVIELKLGKKTLFIPEKVEQTNIISTNSNGFIKTVEKCFDEHRPLVLTPDVIWLAICQGASIHVNENFKTLEKKIFKENKPNELSQRNDSLEFGAQHWKNLIDSISNQTKLYTTSNFYDFFVKDFSTTTKIEKTAYQITLLETYKESFTYVGSTGCGIPYVTLKGYKQDWVNIYSSLKTLDELELKWWREILEPIIQEFINVYDGVINPLFWADIYKNSKRYGAYYLSGWIIKFFPYIKERGKVDYINGEYDEEHYGIKVGEFYKLNPYIYDNDYLMATLTTKNFPSGLAMIDLNWINHYKNENTDLEIYSGYMGMKQYDDKSLEPLISWAVCDKNAELIEPGRLSSYGAGVEHINEYWIPEIIEEPKKEAIYDADTYETSRQSIDFIKQTLVDSIVSNPLFKRDDFEGVKIEFVVMINGELTDIRVKSQRGNRVLEAYIVNLLIHLPKKWQPASTNVTESMMLEYIPKKGDVLLDVNSIVSFEL